MRHGMQGSKRASCILLEMLTTPPRGIVAVERAWTQLFEVVSETMATSIREGMDQGGAVHELIRATQVSHASSVQGPFEVCLST